MCLSQRIRRPPSGRRNSGRQAGLRASSKPTDSTNGCRHALHCGKICGDGIRPRHRAREFRPGPPLTGARRYAKHAIGDPTYAVRPRPAGRGGAEQPRCLRRVPSGRGRRPKGDLRQKKAGRLEGGRRNRATLPPSGGAACAAADPGPGPVICRPRFRLGSLLHDRRPVTSMIIPHGGQRHGIPRRPGKGGADRSSAGLQGAFFDGQPSGRLYSQEPSHCPPCKERFAVFRARQGFPVPRHALQDPLQPQGPHLHPMVAGSGLWKGIPGNLPRLFGRAGTDRDLRRLRA